VTQKHQEFRDLSQDKLENILRDFKAFYLNVLQSADCKVLTRPGCVEHDASSKLIAADLLSKPSLETSLGGKFPFSTPEREILNTSHADLALISKIKTPQPKEI